MAKLGIVAGIIFNTDGLAQILDDITGKSVFNIFMSANTQRFHQRCLIRFCISEDTYLCILSGSGDIVGKSESTPRTTVVMFHKERVVFFVGENNSPIKFPTLNVLTRCWRPKIVRFMNL